MTARDGRAPRRKQAGEKSRLPPEGPGPSGLASPFFGVRLGPGGSAGAARTLGKATKKSGSKAPSGQAAKKRAPGRVTGGRSKKSAKGPPRPAPKGKGSKKGPERNQYAALPYRFGEEGRLEVLLATSRETRRWVIPKGWPMKGLKPHKAAAQEAFEETGAVGQPSKDAIGAYVYWKRLKETFVLCRVKVFPLRVEHLEEVWSEQHERERRWFAQGEAAARVEEPGLRALVAGFVPAAKTKGPKAGKAEPAPDLRPKKSARKAGTGDPTPDARAKKRARKADKGQPAPGARPKKRATKGGKAEPARKPRSKKRATKAKPS